MNAGYLMILLLLLGCADMSTQGANERPILERTILDTEGNPVGEVSVSLAAELVSRGCIALDISTEGQVSFILQQDGSGDWSTVRGIVSIVPETVAVVMNPISTPIAALVEALSGRPTIQPPSEIHGCEGLFVGYEAGLDRANGQGNTDAPDDGQIPSDPD